MTAQLWNHPTGGLSKQGNWGRRDLRRLVTSKFWCSCPMSLNLNDHPPPPACTTQKSPGHPRRPLAKFLDFSDLTTSLCSFPHFFRAFILQTCIDSPVCVSALGTAENLTWARELTFSSSYPAPDLMAPIFMPKEHHNSQWLTSPGGDDCSDISNILDSSWQLQETMPCDPRIQPWWHPRGRRFGPWDTPSKAGSGNALAHTPSYPFLAGMPSVHTMIVDYLNTLGHIYGQSIIYSNNRNPIVS